MKKIFCCFMALAFVALMSAALAENIAIAPVEDLAARGLTFTTDLDEYGDGSFTLARGDQRCTIDSCCDLDTTVYAADMSALHRGTLYMVNEYGPSDDPITYFFLEDMDELRYVGMIPTSVSSLTIDGRGMITGNVRANYVGTWFHPADFILAVGYSFDGDDFEVYEQLAQVPRDLYPMGMIVTLKTDLPLLSARCESKPAETLTADQQVILAASDDAHWLYVSSMDGDTAGWVFMEREPEEYTSLFRVGDERIPEYELFDGIFYAD